MKLHFGNLRGGTLSPASAHMQFLTVSFSSARKRVATRRASGGEKAVDHGNSAPSFHAVNLMTDARLLGCAIRARERGDLGVRKSARFIP